jgi:hypothetical protein
MSTSRRERGSLASVIEKISTFRAKQRGGAKKGDQLLNLLELAKSESTESSVMLILTEAIELRQQEKSRARSMFNRGRSSQKNPQQQLAEDVGGMDRKESFVRNLDTGEVDEIEAVNEVVEEEMRKSLGESPANSPRAGRTSPTWGATIPETGEDTSSILRHTSSELNSSDEGNSVGKGEGGKSEEAGRGAVPEDGEAGNEAEAAGGEASDSQVIATNETLGSEGGDGDDTAEKGKGDAADKGRGKSDSSYTAGVDQADLTGLSKKEREAEFFAQLAKQKREEAEQKVLTPEEIAQKEHDDHKSKMLERQMRTFRSGSTRSSSTAEGGRGRGRGRGKVGTKRMSQPAS